MTESGSRKSKRRRLSEDDAQRLVALVQRDGVQAVAQALGMHPQTVTTLGCGVEANNSTVELVERRLAELDMGGGENG